MILNRIKIFTNHWTEGHFHGPKAKVKVALRREKHSFQMLFRCKMVGVKFYDLFLVIEWLERNFSYFSINFPLAFSEILNVFENTACFYTRHHQIYKSFKPEE